MKIKYESQQFDKGCVVACLAMILNRKQVDIAKEFYTDFNKSGVRPSVIREYLADNGLSVIEKEYESSLGRAKHNKRMLTPFADIHVVSYQCVPDKKTNHAVVMDRRGRIYDPGDKRVKDGRDMYFIVSVIGIWGD